MKTKHWPDVAIHPGEHIADILEGKGMTQRELAEKMGRPLQVVNQIVNGKRGITAETAWQLQDAFAVSAVTWMNLQTRYELNRVRLKRLANAAPV